MNKIVRRHFPAERLPKDLRDEIGDGRHVTITIEIEEELGPQKTAEKDWFSRYERLRRSTFHSLEEVNEHVRAMRDEWDDRER
ncbi:hypothetical protein [Methylocystis sp. JR02]|uniref:hypothetical protein n=1 Tax=Methylocystis sp. JR02 TaxID=3046284 RepID=UPI0024BAA438|nr:hypothetical protein [Methylocystis sp. JR02]MDJ0447740.1 hypothetical protein [Methylocystis sp. JR02]